MLILNISMNITWIKVLIVMQHDIGAKHAFETKELGHF